MHSPGQMLSLQFYLRIDLWSDPGSTRWHGVSNLKTLLADGAVALRHKARGQRSNNRIADGVRDFAVNLVREHYLDCGPTLATEKLAEEHELKVSRETLRRAG